MLIVLKFGGSSVSTAEKIDNAAQIAAGYVEDGHSVVMVVSAKGDTTDDLLKQASEVSAEPSVRELDVLLTVGEQMSMSLMAMRLQEIGIPAISLCGWQAGVLTDEQHGNARILEMHTYRVKHELDKGKVVIVAGFQGISTKGDLTTIGRGGSDTTAVALAASLGADKCLIYTDVDGVYSADPRTVPKAIKHNSVEYDEMLEMASLGAGVLHNRSVELAKNTEIALKVLSSKNSDGGTEVNKRIMEGRRVTSVTCDKDTALIEVKNATINILPDILEILAIAGVTADMMTNIEKRLGITVPESRSDKAIKAIEENRDRFGDITVEADKSVAKVSAVGCGLGGDPMVAARMLKALANEHISVRSIVAGEIKISVLVSVIQAENAVRAVHKEFFGI